MDLWIYDSNLVFSKKKTKQNKTKQTKQNLFQVWVFPQKRNL